MKEEKSPLKELMSNFPYSGRVAWIGIRPVKRGTVKAVEDVNVDEEHGLEGDHYHGASKNRQVTLIQKEHLNAAASFLNRETLAPALTRRNIVVEGINLNALKEQQFRIGEDVILETTGACHPCSRMEKNMGPGGYNAMRGHGGITARVIKGGIIKVGDKVTIKGYE